MSFSVGWPPTPPPSCAASTSRPSRRTSTLAEQKLDHRHSGYPGGLKSTTYGDLRQKNPRRMIEKAVAGMLPHNKLGRKQITKLKVYAGPEHPHSAQQPVPYTISQVAQ